MLSNFDLSYPTTSSQSPNAFVFTMALARAPDAEKDWVPFYTVDFSLQTNTYLFSWADMGIRGFVWYKGLCEISIEQPAFLGGYSKEWHSINSKVHIPGAGMVIRGYDWYQGFLRIKTKM